MKYLGFHIGSLLVMCAAAVAQPSMMGQPITPWSPMFERPFQSQVTDDLVDQMVDHFPLSQPQQQRLRAMAHDHREAFAAFIEEVRPTVEKFKNRYDRTALASRERLEVALEREEALAPIADEQARLDERFFERFKAILSEDQLKLWDDFYRRFNRSRWLKGSRLLEGPIDLIALLEQVAEEAGVEVEALVADEVLLDYSIQLDQAITIRAETLIAGSRRWDRNLTYRMNGDTVAIGPHPQGQAGFNRERRAELRLHERVRDVNRRFYHLIHGSLPEEHQTAFRQGYEQGVMKAADYQLPKAMQFRRLVRCALAIDELDAEQREALQSLSIAYEAQIQPRIAELIRSQDRQARQSIGSKYGEKEKLEARVEEAMAALPTLDARFVEQMDLLLSREQAAAVRSGEPCPAFVP